MDNRTRCGIAAMLLWIMVVTGVFSILSESTLMGLLWLGIALVLVVALVQGTMMSRLEGRKLPIASIALILIILLLVGITEVINLFMTEPNLSVSYLFDVAYSLGIVILGGYSGYLLLRAPRSQAPERSANDPSN